MTSETNQVDVQHWRKLRGVFHASPTNADGRTEIEICEGSATLTFEADESHFHAGGAVHGAHIFKLLDDAAFFAAGSEVRDVFVLTVGFQTNFMRPAGAGVLRAEGRLVRASKRVLWAESKVLTAGGALVATGSGTFLPSEIALDPKIGYREIP